MGVDGIDGIDNMSMVRRERTWAAPSSFDGQSNKDQ